MQEFKFSQPVEVRYADLDTMRHVNNAIYLTYIEQARSGYLAASCQWDWNQLGMVLAKTDINYRTPIHFQHRPLVWIRTSKLGKSSITQEVVISEKDRKDVIYATATVVLVHIDYKSGRPLPLPDYIRQRLRTYEPHKIEE
ncbi:acyl-CoA thioesterase [Cesiribacter andamanensis]|uniref:Long-chain acyl-CoA thioesterase FadM n=1 Tax=Cesiribacter andamanensis AMV16 TaxID=1279009 RepID=M7NS33_9BACT|nr:thioesterase family protein [Cesiribacter andamanensis]EMR01264.1 Long-chain acyl-CoA thioesterase FadM [Cesiribacter andamanensis AMV16]